MKSLFSLYTLAFSLLIAPSAFGLGLGFAFGQFEPRNLPNIAFCINADAVGIQSGLADGGTVTNAFDSFTTNKLQQTTSAKRPTYKFRIDMPGQNAQAGHNAIRFNGTSQSLYVTNCALPTYGTRFLVISNSTSGGLFWEHGPNANSNPGEYFDATSNAAWLFNRGGSSHNAFGLSSWLQNKFAIAMLDYNGTGTYATNGVALGNGSVSGSDVGNSAVTDTLHFMSRNETSVYCGGDLFYAVGYTNSLSVNDQNRVVWWARRTYHLY